MLAGVNRDESTPIHEPTTAADASETDAEPARERAAPQLVIVCGLPGVGKTTVASRAADLVDGEVLRTDAVRKELFPEPEYTEAESRAVYGELLARAATRLADGESVVLDATFKRRRSRRNACGLARAMDVPLRTIKVECDESVVEKRIQNRDGLSDADFEIHQKFRREYEPLEIDHSVVDNSGSEAATLERVTALFSSR